MSSRRVQSAEKSGKARPDSSEKPGGGKRYHLRPVTHESRSKLAELAALEEESDWCDYCFKSSTRHRRYAHLRSNRDCATARERSRMHLLSDAFDELRKVIPKTNYSGEEKPSKISTLKLAIHYIAALTDTLGRPVDRADSSERDSDDESRNKKLRTEPDEQQSSPGESSSIPTDFESDESPESFIFEQGLWYLAEQDADSPENMLSIEETYGLKPRNSSSLPLT